MTIARICMDLQPLWTETYNQAQQKEKPPPQSEVLVIGDIL